MFLGHLAYDPSKTQHVVSLRTHLHRSGPDRTGHQVAEIRGSDTTADVAVDAERIGGFIGEKAGKLREIEMLLDIATRTIK